MGCLEVKITPLRESLVIDVSCLGKHLDVDVRLACKTIEMFTSDITSRLKMSCSLVCTIEENDTYLRVSPKEIQWITEDMGIVYTVKSNTDWIIVTSYK